MSNEGFNQPQPEEVAPAAPQPLAQPQQPVPQQPAYPLAPQQQPQQAGMPPQYPVQQAYGQQQPYQQPYQQGQQQPVYVQPVYVAPGPPKGLSITSMILGLVSLFFGFTVILPLGGLILGIIGVKKEPAGKGMALTGIISSSLAMIGWIVVPLLFIIGALVFGAGAIGFAGTSGY